MAFVYNNKMPCYSWGAASDTGSSGALYSLRNNCYVRQVPLPEYGSVKVYSQTTNAQLLSEATPCDAQLPWKEFCKAFGNSTSSSVFGLTIHGELYWIEANSSYHAFNNSRCMSRVAHASSPYAFSNVCFAAPLQLSELSKNVHAIAITKSGKAFLIVVSDSTDFQNPIFVEIALPSGVNAKALWFVNDAYVLLGDDNKTYVRARVNDDWNTLTGGLYKLDAPFTVAWNTALTEPTFSVPSPPAGGTRATIKAVWGPQYFTQSGASLRNGILLITNTGSGYTADQPVTRAGSGSANTGATARVFSDTLIKHADSTADGVFSNCFISNSGKTWTPTPYINDSFGGSWATENTPTLFGVPVPIKHASWNTVLGSDGKLYQVASGTLRNLLLLDGNQWQSVAASPVNASTTVVCAVNMQSQMFTWGGSNTYGLYGDDSEFSASRNAPTQIASPAEWLKVWSVVGTQFNRYFVALRKDAVCRELDQPMEYWPDSYFSA